MRLSISSNVGAILVAARRADERRPGVLRKGLQSFGSRFIRDTVKKDLSGRPGLRRVTGSGARSWHRLVVGRGRDLELHTWSNAAHIAPHIDVYEPKERPRRFPVRVHAGERWDDMLDGPDLQQAFEDAIAPR